MQRQWGAQHGRYSIRYLPDISRRRSCYTSILGFTVSDSKQVRLINYLPNQLWYLNSITLSFNIAIQKA
jgi:hypothetical protein